MYKTSFEMTPPNPLLHERKNLQFFVTPRKRIVKKGSGKKNNWRIGKAKAPALPRPLVLGKSAGIDGCLLLGAGGKAVRCTIAGIGV